MVEELKGKNGKIVGSGEYFKTIHDNQFLGTLMGNNKKRWDYYYVLGGCSSKIKTILTGQTGNQIKISLNNIARIIKNDLDSGKDGENYIIKKHRKNLREAIQHLSKCGLTGLFSLESKIHKMNFLEGFDGRPIIIPEKYSSGNPVNIKLIYKENITYVNIIAYVSYLGFDFSKAFGLMNETEFNNRKVKVVQGLKAWEGDYLVFNGQKVHVNITVIEKNIAIGAIKINLIKDMEFAMSWGGKSVLGWEPETPKEMLIGWDNVDVYKHEFGHSLGLGDGYTQVWVKNWYELNGVDGDLYADLQLYPKNADGSIDMVMNNNGPVRNNDIEMVLLAFSTGKRQNYQIEAKGWRRIIMGSGRISEAIGRGN